MEMTGINETSVKTVNKDREDRSRFLEKELKKFISASRAKELSSQVHKNTLITCTTRNFLHNVGAWIELDVLLGKSECRIYFTDMEMEYDYTQPLDDYDQIDWKSINYFLESKGYKTTIEVVSHQRLGPISSDYKVFTISWK